MKPLQLFLSALMLVVAGMAHAGVWTWSDSGMPYGWNIELPKDTTEYIWAEDFHYPIGDGMFYTLKETTETYTVFLSSHSTGAGGLPQYVGKEYVKFRKVYYPINWTECFRWERVEVPCSEPGLLCINCVEPCFENGSCIAERVYFKDGRIAWRYVK